MRCGRTRVGTAAVTGLDAEATQIIERAAEVFGELRERNPHDVTIARAGQPVAFDAVLHGVLGVWRHATPMPAVCPTQGSPSPRW